jgi:hypothetical protein
MFQTYLSTVFILGCYACVIRQGFHDVHIHFMYEAHVKSHWPDDGSVRTETCSCLYLNEIYVLVVFDSVYYSLNYETQQDGSSQNFKLWLWDLFLHQWWQDWLCLNYFLKIWNRYERQQQECPVYIKRSSYCHDYDTTAFNAVRYYPTVKLYGTCICV